MFCKKIKKRKIARIYAVLTHFSRNFALRTAIFADFGAIPLHKCINMPLWFNKLKIALCKKYCLLDYVSKKQERKFLPSLILLLTDFVSVLQNFHFVKHNRARSVSADSKKFFVAKFNYRQCKQMLIYFSCKKFATLRAVLRLVYIGLPFQ